MPVLSKYLSGIFFLRFGTILFGLTSFVLMLEIAVFGSSIINSRPGGTWLLARYAMLRMSGVIVSYTGLSALLAALLTFMELSRNRELAVMWSAGMSGWRIFRALLPAMLLACALSFVNENFSAPPAAEKLSSWGAGVYSLSGKGSHSHAEAPRWFRTGELFFSVRHIMPGGRELSGVRVFRISSDGRLRNMITAATVRISGGKWNFHEVSVYTPGSQHPRRVSSLAMDVDFDPALLPPPFMPLREMSITRLLKLSLAQPFGYASPGMLETWAQKRIADIFTIPLLVLLALAMSHVFGLVRGAGHILFAGVSAGFIFFAADAIFVSMGETGDLPPVAAAWMPSLILASVSALLLWRSRAFN